MRDTASDGSGPRAVPRSPWSLAAIAVLGAVLAPVVWPVPDLGDLFQFWFAGHQVAIGGSAYDQPAWVAAYATYGDIASVVHGNCPTPNAPACQWVYPPWTAAALAPFGALPPGIGLPVLHATLVAGLVAAVALLLRRYPPAPSARTLPIVVALAAQPLVIATRSGHFDAFLVVGAVLVAGGLERHGAQLVIGSVLLALKPHLFIALAPIVAVALIARRQGRPLAAAAAALAVLAVGSFVLWPPPPLGVLLGEAAGRPTFDTPTVWTAGRALAPGAATIAGLLLALAGLACAAAAAAWSRQADRGATIVAAGSAASLVLAPYEHSYDHALLLPAIWTAIALAARDRRPVRRAWLLAATVAVAVAYPWFANFADYVRGDQVPSAYVPLATLAVWAIVARVTR